MKHKGAALGLLVGVMVCIAGTLLVMAAMVYSQSSDTAADRALRKMNEDFATKVWVEQRLSETDKRIGNVGEWVTTAQESIKGWGDLQNKNERAHFDELRELKKRIEMLEVRQTTLDKKQIELKASAHRTVEMTHKFDAPMPVDVLHNGPPPKSKTPLLKRSGVSKQ